MKKIKENMVKCGIIAAVILGGIAATNTATAASSNTMACPTCQEAIAEWESGRDW
ncbi:hypothetical protein [Deinococcus enclensis]|uniref:Uncharacterized protein n=1 Tax=Deinococcus enclensis TaxID=1049582 RepID=A0ABT9MJY4_9DEIO|nr:hypothetical protein [Deinococcus enclensis]MDP9766529.1 hypothetical protein [Deinococcus enclensis]